MVRTVVDEVLWTNRYLGKTALDPRVIEALGSVPRERFVPPEWADSAYDNRPLPIGHGQTISQPYIVAVMTDLLHLEPGDRVLEVGTGCGYQAAILARLAAQVCSIETVPELASEAAERLKSLGIANVEVRHGDGYLGWPEGAPFDAIVVTAAAPSLPRALVDQLKPDGRMVIPIGPRGSDQELVLVCKEKDGSLDRRSVLPVAFVPMVPGG
ncbi:MAG: protein-L-isoaspartate(D-aspartate) O-methyltransferase [Alphaproteobacteria bacterium]|nr:protein-L-isoaspartate(D-aspartate) O-methyltransferase [Alphaproteobacteria bacterium]